jgi:RNA-directed DNA polymerase
MIKTTKHLAYCLKVELQEIESILSDIDKFYYEKIEVKKDKDGQPKIKKGKVQKRVIHPSLRRLKIIQSRILHNILAKLEIPDYAYGGIKGRDNISNAKKHQGNKYNFTTDLKDFFPSIRHNQVYEMFIRYKFSPDVASYLTQLTTYKGKLPQGTPTSPIIANLVFVKTGRKLQEFAKENFITFTSFVDDLTFSAPVDFKSRAQYIINTLIDDGFKISHNKTFYKTKNPVVTGLIVKNNRLDLTGSFKIKLQITEGKTEAQIKGLKLYAKRVNESNSKILKKHPAPLHL